MRGRITIRCASITTASYRGSPASSRRSSRTVRTSAASSITAVRSLTIPEIAVIQKLFVQSARRLMQAGYDGVEVHAGNGYLFQQFFTPRINKRTDLYGGSFENRARFLLETVDRLKNELADFPLVVRLSATEFAD